MISLKTKICDLLQISSPIIQAGMAGGATTVELVAAVSEAGGLGTIGAAYMTPDALQTAIEAVQVKTDKPFAVNLFVEESPDDFSRLEEVQQVLGPVYAALGIKDKKNAYRSPNWSREQFDICMEKGVRVISTAFGHLSSEQMEAAKRAGVKTITMATTVEESIAAERAGVDVIVAQGSEAGGHRGTFSLARHPDGAQIGTMSLVPQVVDAVSIPVVAAGGITDGRGLVAALVLGASAVQIGTRFLTASEAGIHPVYKGAIFASTEESTVITKSFSGRPARGIKNRFIEEFEASGAAPLPFPSHNTVMQEIRAAAAKQNNPDYMPLWAGQSTRMLTEVQDAADIVRGIMKEAEQVVK